MLATPSLQHSEVIMAVKPIPDGYHAVLPSMNVKGADKAIDFYRNVFDAKERLRMPGPGGMVMHAEIELGDSVVMLSEAQRDPVFNLSAMLYVKDCDSVFNKAVAAGAKVKMPMQDHPWGDRGGTVIDPFGNQWFIATHTEDVPDEEIRKRMRERMAQQAGR
jgi:PhnB protein